MELAIVLALLVGVAAAACSTASGSPIVGLPSLAVTLAGLHRLPGPGPTARRGCSIGGFPDWFDDLGQQGHRRAGCRSRSCIYVVLAVVAVGRCSTSPGFGRYTYVIGNSARRGPVLGRPRGARQAHHLHDERPRSPRSPACSIAARLGAVRAQHRGGLRAGHHHRGAAGRREHLRRLGHDARACSCRRSWCSTSATAWSSRASPATPRPASSACCSSCPCCCPTSRRGRERRRRAEARARPRRPPPRSVPAPRRTDAGAHGTHRRRVTICTA